MKKIEEKIEKQKKTVALTKVQNKAELQSIINQDLLVHLQYWQEKKSVIGGVRKAAVPNN